jgi:hypothetical protein
MRKFVIPVVLAMALVVPAQAAAKTKHYTGTVSPAGTVGFKVTQKRHSKKKRVSGFNFAGIPVNCADGSHTTHGFVSFPVNVKKGRFNIVASSSVTGATLEVHGNLGAGTIRVAGNVPIDPAGQGTNCDSGVLPWTVHRSGGGGGGGSNCTPGYSPCIPPGPDVDCLGGGGDGPRFVQGPVQVTGSDPYGLDSDGNGVGCEPVP